MGDERPSWLPPGWEMIVKTRSNGKKDKFYVAPSGLQFNSMLKVQQYLEISKVWKPREEVEMKKALDLPPGWFKKVVTTKKKGKIRKDPYYIDPVSGREFRSVPEVFRYLESKDPSKTKSKSDNKSHITLDSPSSTQYKSPSARVTRSMSVDKTPDKLLTRHEIMKSVTGLKNGANSSSTSRGIMLENNHTEQRVKDNYPATTNHSDKMAVADILEKPVKRTEILPNLSDEKVYINKPRKLRSGSTTKHSDEMEVTDFFRKPVKRMEILQNLAVEKVDINEPRVLRSGLKIAAQKQINTAVENNVKQRKGKINFASRDNIPNELPQVKGNEQNEGGRRKRKRLSEIKSKDLFIENKSLKSGTESREVENTMKAENDVSEQCKKGNNTNKESKQDGKKECQNKKKISGRKCTSDLPCRTSTRLSGLRVDQSSDIQKSPIATKESKTLDEANKNAIKLNRKARYSVEPKIITTPESAKGNELKDHLTKLRIKNHLLTKQKERVESSVRDLSSLQEPKEAVVVDHVEENKLRETTDSSLNDILMDPCIEFAVKTLIGEIPIEELKSVNESPVSSLTSPNQTMSYSSPVLPSSHILTDPCFEFAVKTLTSETTLENGSQFQISFEQPSSTLGSGKVNGLTLPRFRLDNYSRLINPLDAIKKSYARQHDPSLPNALCSGSSSQNVNTSPNSHGFQSGTSCKNLK